jgi:hypothetical protein
MAILDDMADITAEHAGEKLRYFAGVDPETGEVSVHHLREDIQWTDHQEREVTEELHEVTAKESYEHTMGVDNVNQVIKVADSKVLFTGFIDDQVAVASFERDIRPSPADRRRLPRIPRRERRRFRRVAPVK